MKFDKKWLKCFLITISFMMFFNANTYGEEILVSSLEKRIDASVDKLMNFGIVNGKEDGEYHPDDELTREEFTKIMVEALGMGNVAAIAPKETKFTDVNPESWSAGYINLAVEKGIIKGGDNNLFNPQQKVTLAEATTIILRGLGYKDEFLSGNWPDNYIIKGVETGVLDGIEISSSSIVNRGMAALMIDKAMDVKLLKSYPNSNNYYISDVTLLDERKDMSILKNVKVLKKEKSNNKYEVTVEFTKDTTYDKNEYEKGDEESFFIRDDFDFDLYEGFSAEVYLDENDKVFYVKYVDLEYEMDNFYGNEIIENNYNQKPFGKIKLSRYNNYIDVSKSADIYVNGYKIESQDFGKYLNEEVFGTFVLENEEVTYADLLTWEKKDYYFRELSASKDVLECIEIESGSERGISLDRYKKGYEIYLVDGNKRKKITPEDIGNGDIMNISEKQEDEEVLIYVWRNRASGMFSKLAGGVYGEDLYFTLDKKKEDYKLAENFAYTYNAGKKVISQRNNTVGGSNALSEFYNELVTINKNWRNEVVFVMSKVNLKLDLYGVLLRYDDGKGQIQIRDKDNRNVTYGFEEEDDYDRLKAYATEGSIIKYSLSKSKKIKKFEDNIADVVIKVDETQRIKKDDDFGEDYVMVDGEKLKVDSDTIFIDYTKHNRYSVTKMTWSKLKGKAVLDDVEVLAAKDGRDLKLLVIWDNMEGIQEDTEFGYVKDKYRLGDKHYVELLNHVLDEPKKYEIDEDYVNVLANGRIVMYGITSDNKFKIVEDEEYGFASGEIEDIKGDTVILEGEAYKTSRDTVVFYNGKKLDADSLNEGDLITIYEEDGYISIVESLGKNRKDRFTKGRLKDIRPSQENCFVIEMDGEERKFSRAKGIDFIFINQYLETKDKNDELIEALEHIIGNDTPEVKFFYDKDTEEIVDMWIDMEF